MSEAFVKTQTIVTTPLPLPFHRNSPTPAIDVAFSEAVLPPFSSLDTVILCTVNYFRYLPNAGIIKFGGPKACNYNVFQFPSLF